MIDLLYGDHKCRVHAEPVWDALPDEARGQRVVRDSAAGFPPPPRRSLPGRAVIVASANDASAAYRLGYRRIALLEHGIGQSYVGLTSHSYPGGPGRDMVGLFLSPNETAASKDREAYPDARVVVVGSPRLDTLPRRMSQKDSMTKGPVVAISFHWSGRLPELKSAFPHYRAALPVLAERFTLIGHCHPMAARDILPEYRKTGIEIVEDFEEVCRRADVYVADNTSTLYEFASTGRPVVVLNAPWYRREVEHGLRFWEAATVGPQVYEPDDLADDVGRSLMDSPANERCREAALDIVYVYRNGAGTRAADAVMEWLA